MGHTILEYTLTLYAFLCLHDDSRGGIRFALSVRSSVSVRPFATLYGIVCAINSSPSFQWTFLRPYTLVMDPMMCTWILELKLILTELQPFLVILGIFCRRHCKMKFDIDPGYILDCSYNFTLVNLIRYRACKKTSLTSLRVTRYTVYRADIFFISIVCNTQRRKKDCDVP